MGLEWVAPTIAGFFLLSATIATAVIGYRTSKSGARENRAPDVTESWAEADRVRIIAWRLFELYLLLRTAFRGYQARVRAGGTTDLTADEQKALEADPPNPAQPNKPA